MQKQQFIFESWPYEGSTETRFTKWISKLNRSIVGRFGDSSEDLRSAECAQRSLEFISGDTPDAGARNYTIPCLLGVVRSRSLEQSDAFPWDVTDKSKTNQTVRCNAKNEINLKAVKTSSVHYSKNKFSTYKYGQKGISSKGFASIKIFSCVSHVSLNSRCNNYFEILV